MKAQVSTLPEFERDKPLNPKAARRNSSVGCFFVVVLGRTWSEPDRGRSLVCAATGKIASDTLTAH